MKNRVAVIAFLFVSIASGMVRSALAAEASLATVFGRETKSYQFALLSKTWQDEPIPPERSDRLARVSRFTADQFVRDGAVLIGGPVQSDDESEGDLVEVMVLDLGSIEEGERVLKLLPSVEAGDRKADVYTLIAPVDLLKKSADPTDVRDLYLGLLQRAPNSARKGDFDAEEIEKAHLDYVREMVAEGDVALAGPLEGGGDLRGILIFRAADRKHVEGLISRDPAVQVGRYEIELYRWTVPEACPGRAGRERPEAAPSLSRTPGAPRVGLVHQLVDRVEHALRGWAWRSSRRRSRRAGGASLAVSVRGGASSQSKPPCSSRAPAAACRPRRRRARPRRGTARDWSSSATRAITPARSNGSSVCTSIISTSTPAAASCSAASSSDAQHAP